MFDEFSWCTVREASGATGRSERTIYRWMKEHGHTANKNPHHGFRIRTRGKKRIHKADFLKWIINGNDDNTNEGDEDVNE